MIITALGTIVLVILLAQCGNLSIVKVKVLLLYSTTRPEVSVALYNLTPGRGLAQPWCEPSPWGGQSRWAAYIPCRASTKYLSSLCFASPNFTPWYGGASQWYKETCSPSPSAAVMVVMAVGIEPRPPTYKPCLLTTTLPWLTIKYCKATGKVRHFLAWFRGKITPLYQLLTSCKHWTDAK